MKICKGDFAARRRKMGEEARVVRELSEAADAEMKAGKHPLDVLRDMGFELSIENIPGKPPGVGLMNDAAMPMGVQAWGAAFTVEHGEAILVRLMADDFGSDASPESDLLMVEYQREVLRHAEIPTKQKLPTLAYLALSLASEAGEVAGVIEEELHNHGVDGGDGEALRDRLVDELGDALWGVTAMAGALGVTLGEVALSNMAKLALRRKEKADGTR